MAYTVVITDLGNDVQFEFSNGHKYTLNKLSMRVKQNDKYVFITNAGGFIDSAENKTIRLTYEDVSSPVYASNDALFSGLITLASTVSLGGGGGGASGGGNNTWSNTQGNFTATPTVGANTITITGLPFTLEDGHVALGSIKKISSTGEVTDLALTTVAVSGNVITLTDEGDFAAGDTVEVVLFGQDKAYDQSLDANIVYNLNPEYSHYTSPENLISLSAQGAATSRYVIPMEGYKDISIHWKIANTDAGDTITLSLWATNNENADDTADTDWVDVSSLLTGTLTVNNGTVEAWNQLNDIIPLKLMVKVVTTSGAAANTNAIDVYIKKA